VPGLFGGCCTNAAVLASLEDEFEKAVGPCVTRRAPGLLLGAHGFAQDQPTWPISDSLTAAVDGDHSWYSPSFQRDEASEAIATAATRGRPVILQKAGNIAVANADDGSLYIASDWSGSFPLYYSITDDGLLFASLLRPLCRTIGATPDLAGIASLLKYGHQIGQRSIAQNVHRLLPGQCLAYSREMGEARILESSRAWAGEVGCNQATGNELLEQIWQAAIEALPRLEIPHSALGLMMSAGWDSRTILAAWLARHPGESITTYTHGDVKSRELRIVTQIAQGLDVSHLIEPLAESVFDPVGLEAMFTSTEAIQFPHWNRAATILNARGITLATAGVYGEVLGGHYGPAMLHTGLRKILSVGASVAGIPTSTRMVDPESSLSQTARIVPDRAFPWIVSDQFTDVREELSIAHKADVRKTIRRLQERGVKSMDALIEAFVAENRGSQLITSQLRCMRDVMHVSLPFCDHRFLNLVAGVPLAVKVHNRLNQRLLRRFAPELLQYPSAATLASSASPIWVQEGSRLVRRLVEKGQWKIHRTRPSYVDRPRNGWLNFDFLKTSHALQTIREDLRSPLWNYRRMDERLHRFAAGAETMSASTFAETMLRAYSVELTFR
jgi:hypothetical protein